MDRSLARADYAATDTDCPRAETGEQRLIAAVLSRAIEDARRADRDACDWIASDELGARVGGWHYRDICAVLGLDAAWARAQVAGEEPVRLGGRSMAGAGRGEVRPARRKVA